MRGIDPIPMYVACRLSVGLWCVLIFASASGGTCWAAERSSERPAQPLVYLPSPDIPLSKGAFLGYETAIRIGLDRHPLLRRSRRRRLLRKRSRIRRRLAITLS